MKNCKNQWKLIPLTLFLLGISTTGSAGNTLEMAEKLFPEKPEKAVRLLKKEIKSKDNELSLKCRIRLAEYYDSQKQFDQVFKLLNKYTSFSSLSKDKIPFLFAVEAYCENAYASGANGDIYKGLKALDIAKDRNKNLESSLISYYFAKLLHFYAKDTKAMQHINEGLLTGGNFIKSLKDEYENKAQREKQRAYWKYIKNKLTNLQFEIEFSIFAETYGFDYALYKTARTYHMTGHFKKATGYYNRVITEFGDSLFAEAARCYILDSQLNDSSKSFAEIEKEGEKFIKANPYAVYRGEALAILGRHSMDRLLDIKRVEKNYSLAYEFCERSRKLKENEILFIVPQKIKSIGVVDSPFTSFDDAYFSVIRKIQPEEIINRETNKYYIDYLQKECAFMLGFVKFVQGKPGEATKFFDEVGRFDKELLKIESKNMPNALARLRGACKQGFFYLNQEELKHFKGKDRVRILLADFYFALEKFKKAYGLYCDFLISEDPAQKSLAYIRKGYCESYMQKGDLAEESFKAAIKLSKRKKNIQIHAAYSLGCLMDARSGKFDLAKKYLKASASKGQNTYYGRLAHFRLVTSLGLRGQVTESKKEYVKFCKIYSEKKSEDMENFFKFCNSKVNK